MLVLTVSLFALAGGAFTESAFAFDALTAFTYSMAVPTGELKDYTNEGGLRGLGFNYRYFILNRLSVGFGFGWQSFSRLPHHGKAYTASYEDFFQLGCPVPFDRASLPK